ncbi:MAG: peptidylprolyl isomerase [Clostridia bacterium]|nr:peptidylprolyl isomerase [Clostridia bacterium]
MKKLLIYTLAAILAFALLLSSCGAPKIVKTLGAYEVDEDLYELFDGSDEGVAGFFAPYALADKYGVDHESENFKTKCEAEMARVISEDYFGDEDAMRDAVKENDLTDELWDKIIEQSVLYTDVYEALVEKGTIVSDPEKLKEEFLTGGAVYVKRIMLGASSAGPYDAEPGVGQLEAAYDKIVSGARSFDEAKRDFIGYTSTDDVGNYENGYIVVRGATEKTYEDVCFSLAVNDVSKPFETSKGYCIVMRFALTEDMVDEALDYLVASSMEGQYNVMLDDAAAELLNSRGSLSDQ